MNTSVTSSSPIVHAKPVDFFRELRAPFFTASLVPVALGIAMAYRLSGVVDIPLALITFLGVVAIHAGANTANDYFDHRSGNDEANTRYLRPFTGGSRLIQQGKLAPGHVLFLSMLCFLIGGISGLYLAWRIGWPVLVLSAAGMIGGYAYTAPPLKLGYRGWGELLIAITFGMLPTVGAYYVQARSLALPVFIAALPITFLITAILYVNQFPDYEADKAVAKRNWVVRLGPKPARLPYIALMLLWAPALILAVIRDIIPSSTLISLIMLIPCAIAIRILWNHSDNVQRLAPASALTALSHLGVGLLMTLALCL
jgi:1,4-dihydroxy-2-naphthoate octaprenyltransferase